MPKIANPKVEAGQFNGRASASTGAVVLMVSVTCVSGLAAAICGGLKAQVLRPGRPLQGEKLTAFRNCPPAGFKSKV